MKRLALCLLAMSVPCVALAQDGPDPQVVMNIHVQAADFSQGACGAYGDEGGDCAGSSHAGNAGQSFLFVIASNLDGWTEPGNVGNGIGGLQFGIDYSGLNVQTWFLCTNDLEAPQNDGNGVWPASGTGNAVTWPGGCYDPGGENASVGIFLVDDASGGTMGTTPDPRTGDAFAVYTDCDAFTWSFTGLNGANIGDSSSGPDCTPAVPTVESSWGEIKNMF